MSSRRNPEMEKYTVIQNRRVILTINGQQFFVGQVWDNDDEAKWYRDMLCIALAAIVAEGATR